jgi:hypothetical protein
MPRDGVRMGRIHPRLFSGQLIQGLSPVICRGPATVCGLREKRSGSSALKGEDMNWRGI